ncbi:spore coat-associated protein CotJA [Bacillus spizizenii]|uniref:Spore coat-associated protein CotJA n=1 Tax=Bacillus spizizenii TaxID=96241 RepID=A0A9Q4DNW6_BACSC|nr:spore coat-associated protein CotJA [Bacillus spizizenii]KFI01800.1 CotJA [Bacillus sp. BSC154]KJJ40326.1 CotJA [Bacillus subtilis]MCY7761830.1 spore coat-associated protein CotJA [Bacillus spizizenii]MCY7808818.1 spore coat-associated protein CotJA [Bacillus spizizenii]MCY7810712.1 spore coat-associated protein CotJA [Bacillus spizizenii]
MKDMQPFTPVKSYTPFHSRFDPCPPIGKKYYRTPPNLYMTFQPEHMEQFSPMEALRKGTLWKDLYDFYENPYRGGDVHGKKG